MNERCEGFASLPSNGSSAGNARRARIPLWHQRRRTPLAAGPFACGERPKGARHPGVVGELQSCSHNLAVRDGLVVHLDLRGAVVCNHDNDWRIVTHGCVNLDGIEAERPVTSGDEDFSVRVGEAGGNAIGHADTNAAEGSTWQPAPGDRSVASLPNPDRLLMGGCRQRQQGRSQRVTSPWQQRRCRKANGLGEQGTKAMRTHITANATTSAASTENHRVVTRQK
jgi:hypothetical protein